METKQQHTPGPWRYADGRIYGTDFRREGEEILIADTAPDNAALSEMDEPNGLLIAAAPELLAACEGVLHHNDGLKDAHKLPESLVRQVRAAIAKATGDTTTAQTAEALNGRR